QDDDSGGGTQFKLTTFMQPNVTYILVVTTFTGSVTGAFMIVVSGPSGVSLIQTNSTSVTTSSSTTSGIATATLGTVPIHTTTLGTVPTHTTTLGTVPTHTTTLGTVPIHTTTLGTVPIHTTTLGTVPTHTTTLGTVPIHTTTIPSIGSCLTWNQNSIIVAGNGTAGNSTSMLYYPWDLSIDINSNFYVNDYFNNRIMKFSSGSLVGIPLTSGAGTGPSQVNYPTGSAMDTYGNLYICDTINARIMKYANISSASRSPPITGQVVAGGSWGIGYNQQQVSWGVAVDALGNVFVSDYSSNRVMKWAPGSTTGTLAAGIGNGTAGNGTNQLSGPIGIYVDQSLALYIADHTNNRIQKWLNGALTGITVASGANGQLFYPTDVIVDAYGTIYVLAIGGLYRFYPGSIIGTNVISTYIFGYGFNTSCGIRMATIPAVSAKDLLTASL
ncbi:unnamed protein product, partial [Rotaria sp. Silwood2]